MNVEIWSDVVCPWCYLGKRRFERALASFDHRDEVTVTYRSFELDSRAPAQRTGTHAEHLARKYGMTIAQAERANQQMTQRAAADGLEFRLDRIRGGNTFDAHRLLHLAKAEGRQAELKEAFLAANFVEARNLADHAVLREIAVAAGLPADRVDAVLAGDEYGADVRADVDRARAYGATGVPFFVVDEKYGVSGAQPTELFGQLLERAWRESHPTVELVGGEADGACGPDGCPI
jgi:predicted DsbA family dithiol-disulfide isomerase